MPFLTAAQVAAQTARRQAVNLVIIAMREDGKTRDEIADALEISLSGVDKRIQRLLAAGRISVVPAGTTRRQMGVSRQSKPQPVARSAGMRRCLCDCNALFMSDGPGNRIAPGHASGIGGNI